MQAQIPLTKDIVLIGGGHTHALVMRMWGMNPVPGVRLTVIDPQPVATYTGMLPGLVAGHYTQDQVEIDLVRLSRFAGARLVLEKVQGIDLKAKTLRVAGREIGFDVVSFDIGITADLPGVEGFSEQGIPVKPFARFAKGWAQFSKLDDGIGQVSVIGNGLGGVELALAMAHRLGPGRVRVIGGADVAHVGKALNTRLLRALTSAGIELVSGRVAKVFANRIQLTDGRTLASEFTVGAAGATPQPWLKGTDLPLKDGFIKVNSWLQVLDRADVFAAGDCAHLEQSPRPKAGVFAVRAAPVLWHNLRASVTGQPFRSFRPQRQFLRLVSLGDKIGAAEKWQGLPFVLSGRLIWRWKDWIDQRFMNRFDNLPAMKIPVPEGAAEGVGDILRAAPLCAGCGAKVGGNVLAEVLATLDQPGRKDVLTGPGDDAGVLVIGGRKQVLTTDHIRAFCDDPGLMARIAAQHALGDVRAMGARPQSALVQLTLPRANEAIQSRMLREIMQAAGQVFGAEGAIILGGHTSMGAELTIGYSVTGLCETDPVLVTGAKAGDALILTGRIGAGVLLAAEMQGKARGVDIALLWSAMAVGPGDLSPLYQAHAMTDVTGFGLAGHLMVMCQGAGLGAQLWADRVPLYDGALAAAEQGIRSTIYAANLANAPVFGAMGPRETLLYDPQTAGGFLAAVAPDKAQTVIQTLRDAGTPCTQIGEMTKGPVGITLEKS